MFELEYTPEADDNLTALENDPAKLRHLKAVVKSLGLLAQNPKHPSLNTHEFHSKAGPNGEKVFEAYAENKTPTAWRIFFCYPKISAPAPTAVKQKIPARKTPVILILAITPHP